MAREAGKHVKFRQNDLPIYEGSVHVIPLRNLTHQARSFPDFDERELGCAAICLFT